MNGLPLADVGIAYHQNYFNQKALTPFPVFPTEIQADLCYIPGKGNEMIILRNKRNKENFDAWYIDNTGTIRLVSKIDSVNITYKYRNSNKDSFNFLLITSFK
jgi:hypothetical protein